MQIYVAALLEAAGTTPVGKSWMLDRTKVMIDLGITDLAFDRLQQQLEARLPGTWDKAADANQRIYTYLRTG